jgi:hypothetical protein
VTRTGTTDVPDGVEQVAGDVVTPEGARRACDGAAVVRVVGLFNPMVRELSETLYQFERPFASDASKFLGAFGPFVPTPHREAVGRTMHWFQQRYAA